MTPASENDAPLLSPLSDKPKQTVSSDKESPVIQLINKIITDACHQNASDIHVEPQPGNENVIVRLRIDGVCQQYDNSIPYTYKHDVISYIKSLAGLDIEENRKPQLGKIRLNPYDGGSDIELRVVTYPTQEGLEDIILHLDTRKEPLPLDALGFSEINYQRFISCLGQSYGVIWVCGPPNSGKMTTLYAALKYLNKAEKKICTAEEYPIKSFLKGIRQVRINPDIGFDFADAIRAFAFSDADVMMVSKLRDKETVSVSIESALNGHLVLGGLDIHTRSPVESISRLFEMEIDAFGLANAMIGILGQQLVITLCHACKEPYHPSEAEYDALVQAYGNEAFEKYVNIPYSDALRLYHPRGCEVCHDSGYYSRTAIHELLPGTDEIKRLIRTKADMKLFYQQAISEGMKTLLQDGIEKIFAGLTDWYQVNNSCR